MAIVSFPLALSYDTRGVLAAANLTSGIDQRRVNCFYEILRGALNTNPTVILNKRPGVTQAAGTFGTNTQVPYVVGFDPAGTWDAAPWIFVKDGTANKVVNSSTSTTILTDGDYYPRFFDLIRHGDNQYAVIQLQNGASPTASTNAIKTYYATAIGSWTQISDAQYTGISHRGKMEFLNGYAFQMDDKNRVYHSSVNDMSTWDGTYYGRTITLDTAQGLIKHRNQLVILGEDTCEVASVQNVTTTGSPLGIIPFSSQRVGLSSVAGGGTGGITGKTSYYASIGDMTFFLGRMAGRGSNEASLIYYNGRTFEKVSRTVEDRILSSTTVYSVSTINFGGKIAVGVQLTLPTASTQKWLMFFPDINDWFEWESTVFSPVNNGAYFLGVAEPDRLFQFSAANTWQDDGTNYTVTIQFRIPFDDYRWKVMNMCGVIADTLSTQNLGVSFSDNDGASWSTARNIDLSLKKKEITGCGGFRERTVRLTHTDSGELRLRKFYSHLSSGGDNEDRQ